MDDSSALLLYPKGSPPPHPPTPTYEIAFFSSDRIRHQLLQALAEMKSEDLEGMKNKSLSEISKKLLNLRFRNFTNINGENVFIGKQRKKKGRLPFFIKVSCLSFECTLYVLFRMAGELSNREKANKRRIPLRRASFKGKEGEKRRQRMVTKDSKGRSRPKKGLERNYTSKRSPLIKNKGRLLSHFNT